MNKGIDKKSTYKEIDVKGAGIIRINLSKTLGGVFLMCQYIAQKKWNIN